LSLKIVFVALHVMMMQYLHLLSRLGLVSSVSCFSVCEKILSCE